MRAAGGPFVLETVTIEPPRADEALVRVVATGMCHTDMVVRDQVYPVPLPIVLGHEGAGIVEAVGERVTKVVAGDHVVLTFDSCGACRTCQSGVAAGCERFNALNFAAARRDGSHAIRAGGGAVHDRFFGQSSFATYAIAAERSLVKVRRDAPLEMLGPLGCGVQTGAGTVLNALRVSAGSSFAAFGAGAVGLSAVMAAHAAGATTIVAVDVVPERLALARELGATLTIDARSERPVEAIRNATGGGVDFSLDSTALAAVIRQAVEALRPRGACAVVGASPPGTELAVDVMDLMQNGKTIRGVVEGDSVPDVFIPRLVDLFVQGHFPIDKLVRFYPFAAIDDAAADSERGVTVKPVLRMDA
ncbi:MAG TPA: NAD(P)-dependent alcohol dehydrogenase [Candidatus Baltobacteraceae bacterium]|nr:NAD(P)-dependent alcohol dehydrogenase [Candidatus Baltobacteraceae bacterium]